MDSNDSDAESEDSLAIARWDFGHIVYSTPHKIFIV